MTTHGKHNRCKRCARVHCVCLRAQVAALSPTGATGATGVGLGCGCRDAAVVLGAGDGIPRCGKCGQGGPCGGVTGPTGPCCTGATGPSGETGATGATGPTSEQGQQGLSQYAYLYRAIPDTIVAPDTVGPDADVIMPVTTVATAGLVVGGGGQTVTVVTAGVYEIEWFVDSIDTNRFAIFVDGLAALPGSLYGAESDASSPSLSLFNTVTQEVAPDNGILWNQESVPTDQTNDFDLITDLPTTSSIAIRRPGRYELTLTLGKTGAVDPVTFATFLDLVELPGTRVVVANPDAAVAGPNSVYTTISNIFLVGAPNQQLQVRNIGILPATIGIGDVSGIVGASLILKRIGPGAPVQNHGRVVASLPAGAVLSLRNQTEEGAVRLAPWAGGLPSSPTPVVSASLSVKKLSS